MANTKCPARYKNVGLETYGNKKKVTEELLEQFCKNDEYLYQQIRILLDATDPETRNRFYPPTFEDETKSFGYSNGVNDEKRCYKFNDGEEYVYQVDFTTNNDRRYRSGHIVYANDESLIDFEKTGSDIHIYADEDGGHAKISQITGVKQEKVLKEAPPTNKVTKTTPTIVDDGKVLLDSYYTNYEFTDGYSYKTPTLVSASVGTLEKYKLSGKSLTSLTDKELNGIALTQKTSNGYPTYAIAQTFIPQHTGWISKVAMQINFFGSNSSHASYPIICEIRTTKKGAPTEKVLGRTEKIIDNKSFKKEIFKFKKHINVKKGKQYAIVMRGSYTSYHVGGFPNGAYTNGIVDGSVSK